MSVLAYEVVAWLFLVGIYGVVTSRNLIHLPKRGPGGCTTNCWRNELLEKRVAS